MSGPSLSPSGYGIAGMGRFEEQANLGLLIFRILCTGVGVGSRCRSNVPAESIIALIAQLDVQIESDALTVHRTSAHSVHFEFLAQIFTNRDKTSYSTPCTSS